MKRASKILLALIITAVASVPAAVLAADAEASIAPRPEGRSGTWEASLPIIFAESATISGQNGSQVHVNAGTGFGFGFGYNFNEHFQVNGLFAWNVRSFDAANATLQYSDYMDTSTLMVSGVVYLLKGNLTPFVSAGVGIARVDANIESGPGTGPYVPSRTENDMTYGAGIGVRYDLSRQFSLQGSYNKNWIDMSKASSMPDFSVWRLDLVFPM